MGTGHHESQGNDHGRKTAIVMKIRCLQCKTTYGIDSALIAEGGTKVRCSRCKVTFWAFPDGKTSPVTPQLAATNRKKTTEPSEPKTESPPDDIQGKQFRKFIANSFLSNRAQNVVLRNVSSRNELVSLSPNSIAWFRNCGKKTLHEILAFIREINPMAAGDGSAASAEEGSESAEGENAQAETPAKDILRKAPTDDRLGALPLFSNTEIPDFSARDLHPDYKADLKISDVHFSVRAANALENMGIKTLGDVMMTPFSRLLLQKSFGRTTLEEIQARIRKTILFAPKELSPSDIVSSSYDEMITEFVREAIKNERNATILLRRLLPETDKLRTYDEIGEEFDITRERVRQIIRKGLRKIALPMVQAKLAPFFDKLGNIIREGGGIIDVDSLALKTREAFGWKAPLNPKALALLLEMDEQIRHDKENSDWILVPDCECLTCEYPMTVLDGGLPDDTSTAVGDFAEQLTTSCKASCGQSKTIERFHTAFVERLIDASDGRYLIKDDAIFPYRVWQTKQSNQLDQVIHRVLQAVGRPVHFTEAVQMIREASEHYQNVSERYVHSVLIGHPDTVLMGRGIYGLLEWESPRDCTAFQAIQKVLKSAGLPLKKADITDSLKADYPEREIVTELKQYKSFVEIGFDYFDLKKRWEATSPEKLLEGLHDPIVPFLEFILTNNNCSYKPVLTFLILENMDDKGEIFRSNLKEIFFDFYLQRKQKNLKVESDSCSANRVDTDNKNKLKHVIIAEPLKRLLGSSFFHFSDIQNQIIIDQSIFRSLTIFSMEAIKISFLKWIELYFLSLENEESAQDDKTNNELCIHKQGMNRSFQDLDSSDNQEEKEESDSFDILKIRKKKRSKIRI